MNIKKAHSKYLIDRRPPRRSANVSAATVKTFGIVRYTAGNAPKRATA
jgi:hypothetical protein